MFSFLTGGSLRRDGPQLRHDNKRKRPEAHFANNHPAFLPDISKHCRPDGGDSTHYSIAILMDCGRIVKDYCSKTGRESR